MNFLDPKFLRLFEQLIQIHDSGAREGVTSVGWGWRRRERVARMWWSKWRAEKKKEKERSFMEGMEGKRRNVGEKINKTKVLISFTLNDLRKLEVISH